MSTNSSRYSHQPEKNYTQVVLSQGSMVTDSDQKESQVLAQANTTTLGEVAIETGVPKTGGVLRYETENGPADTQRVVGLQPGRIVADGFVGEVTTNEELEQVSNLDLIKKQQGLLDGVALPTTGQFCLFGDLWLRHVGAAEDSRLVDTAFLSAETAGRKQQLAQLKFIETDGLSEAELRAAVEKSLPRFGDLRLLSVAFASDVVAPDACDPCATDIVDETLDAGNDLMRIEIHDSPFNQPVLAAADDTFPVVPASQHIIVKHSRDNASVEVPVEQIDTLFVDDTYRNAVFEMADVAGEQRLGCYSEGMNRRSRLVTFDELEAAAIAEDPIGTKIIRVWDGAVRLDLSQERLDPVAVGLASAEGRIRKEGDFWFLELTIGGVICEFSAQVRSNGLPYILPGDAYSIEIREYASTSSEQLFWHDTPVETTHHYTFLGVVAGQEFVNETRTDVRSRSFPALTELDGNDVAWSNHHHNDVDANTVQGAIDLLFSRDFEGDCLCTFCIDPVQDFTQQMHQIVAKIAELGPSAKVLLCIPAGNWVLTDSIEFRNAGSLTIRGAGSANTILNFVSDSDDPMFEAQGCTSISFEDCSVLNKAKNSSVLLSLENTKHVRFYRTAIVAESTSSARFDKAIHVKESTSGGTVFPHSVELRESHFLLGSGTAGLFVVGPSKLVVENCQFATSPTFYPTFGVKMAAVELAVEAMEVVNRTARRLADTSGRYVSIEGNNQLMYDTHAIAVEDRGAVVTFWDKASKFIRFDGELSSVAAFGEVKKKLAALNWATKRAAEAEYAVLTENSAAAETESVRPLPLPILAGVLGVENSEVTAEIAAATVSAEMPMIPLVLPMNVLNVRGIPRPEDELAEREASARIALGNDEAITMNAAANHVFLEDALELLIPELEIKDYFDVIGDLTIAPKAPFVPSYGIISRSSKEIETTIVGNRFNGIDVAIALRGANKKKPASARVALPAVVTIRDNTIVRTYREGILPPSDAIGSLPGYPVVCFGCDNVMIENNTVQQSLNAMSEAEALLSPTMDEKDARFSAIALGGFIGSVLRVTGNTAQNFRHCVYTYGEPALHSGSQAFEETDNSETHENFRSNFWVYTQNSVFPNGQLNLAVAVFRNWAVAFKGSNQVLVTSHVRVEEHLNHPER